MKMTTSKQKINFSLTKAVVLIFAVSSVFTVNTCHASRSKLKLTSRNPSYTIPQDQKTSVDNSTIFNVLNFGAKGDGKSDDTKAFEAAWEAACKVKGSTVIVPSESVFLVNPISFTGPDCQPNITFQLDGKIIAPTNSEAWGSGLLQWIEFKKLESVTVRGNGIIDGQGSVWWADSPEYTSTSESAGSLSQQYSNETDDRKMPSTKPAALRFYGSTGVTVTGITIQNSARAHLKFNDCTNVQVFKISVSSPGNSPNTDGIHLQNSKDIVIYNSNLACGDDCVSIQTGCSNVYIHNVSCGPSHGISIGSLGKDNTRACVLNITVRDVKISDSLTGVRIKTWQGGSGSVQNVMFSNIQVSDVKTPIMIDQFYCDKSTCANETIAVAVSGINYVNVRGTYTGKPVHFACSDSLPCSSVSLSSIDLTPANKSQIPFCWEAYGELETATVPEIGCLKTGKPSGATLHSNSESC